MSVARIPNVYVASTSGAIPDIRPLGASVVPGGRCPDIKWYVTLEPSGS